MKHPLVEDAPRLRSTTTILHPPSAPLRRRDTPSARHRETVRQLATLEVPPSPSAYDPPATVGVLLLEHVAYLRQLVDVCAPLFDYGGARVESFDIVRAAVEDFLAPMTSAAERIVGDD